jgi:hypothetical protein
VTEPFRDEMSAALTRAEKLAEENQDLRDELLRLRDTAHSVRAQSPGDALATQTLAVLERLEAATHVDGAPLVTKGDRADVSELADLPKPPAYEKSGTLAAPPLPLPPRGSSGVRVVTLIIACLVCLAIGIMLGAMTR